MSQEDRPGRGGIIVCRVPETNIFYVGLNGDNGSRIEGSEGVADYLRTFGETFRDENLGVEPIFRDIGEEDAALFRRTRLELIAQRQNKAPIDPSQAPLIS